MMDDFAALIAKAKEFAERGAFEDALEMLKKGVAANPDQAELRSAFAALLRKAERWEDLIDLLRSESGRASATEQAQYKALVEMAEVYLHKLDKGLLAIGVVKRALELKPDGIEAVDLMISVHRQQANWMQLLRLVEQQIERSENTAQVASLVERVALITPEQLSSSRQAMLTFERLLTRAPEHPPARDALLALYERQGAWEKLIILKKDHLLPHCDEEQRLAMAVELANLAEQKVRRFAVQAELWEIVRTLDPLHLDALEALDGLYQRGMQWGQLADVLRSRLQLHLDLESRTQLLQRYAVLCQDRLKNESGNESRAIDAWRELLSLNPSHQRARNVLRDYYLLHGDIEALDDLYAGHDAGSYALVLDQMWRSDSTAMCAKLLRRVAVLYREDVGRLDLSIARFESLSQLEPDDRDVIQTLVELYEDTSDRRKLVVAYGRLLKLTDDPFAKVSLLQTQAELYERYLRNPSQALQCWLDALALRHDDTFMLDEACRLAQLSDEWKRLVDAFQNIAESLVRERRVAFLERVALAQRHIPGQLEAAYATYEAILDIEPCHAEAHEVLSRVLIAEGRHEDLFELHLRRLQTEGSGGSQADKERRLAIYFEVAELLEEKIGTPADALEMLARALRESPEDARTLNLLDGLAARHDLWDLLMKLYRDVSSEPLPAAAHIAVRSRVAKVYENHFSNRGRALAAYRRVLDLDPTNASARSAVARLEP